jgi:5'-methylthioadenosine phosphorylase
MNQKPVLAVIGGSGLYQMSGLKDVETIDLDTPFGKPSAPVMLGKLAGKPVAFLARHGIGHTISPSEVNYQANIYALKSLGCDHVVSISACGSLREDYRPGDIVIPDQIFDFTRGCRLRTFFGDGIVAHVGTADPYCAGLSEMVFQAVKSTHATVHRGGSLVVIEGPRFSTKSESQVFRSWGMSIIGMTATPEIFLAREAEMCYSTMSHVTDYDVWRVSEEPVSVEMVIRTLIKSTETAQQALENLAAVLPEETPCACHQALSSAVMTNPEMFPAKTYQKLSLFLDKYYSK